MLKSSISLLIFYVLDLSIIAKVTLKPLMVRGILSRFFYNSTFLYIYFEDILLGTDKFSIVITSWWC